jgi:hypothetical protein
MAKRARQIHLMTEPAGQVLLTPTDHARARERNHPRQLAFSVKALIAGNTSRAAATFQKCSNIR